MADYVRKTILSQGYVHIEGVRLSDEQKRQFEVSIAEYQKPRAKILLGKDIVPEVRTRDGSLKVYLSIYGSLADALTDQSDFMIGINSLYGASKMLADACNLESLYLSNARKKAMIRSEARTGVVGTIKDLFDRLNYLNQPRQAESHEKISKHIADLEKRIIFLNQQLVYGRDKSLVWSNLIPMALKFSAIVYRTQIAPSEEHLKQYKFSINEIVVMLKKFSAEGDSSN